MLNEKSVVGDGWVDATKTFFWGWELGRQRQERKGERREREEESHTLRRSAGKDLSSLTSWTNVRGGHTSRVGTADVVYPAAQLVGMECCRKTPQLRVLAGLYFGSKDGFRMATYALGFSSISGSTKPSFSNSFSSSPDWCMLSMMSHPPTNSPLT